MAEITLKKVTKSFDATEVVRSIDLDIATKEFLVMVGPSGCGKTTTLRMIAGLDRVSAGEIWIDGKLVNDVPAKDRDIAMVFQNYALFPHMTVFDNMAFGLWLRKTDKSEIEQRVKQAAGILSISELLHRRPGQLSGGQRQRVAMGRAIVRNAKVFLFDEPLSNLDAKLRITMRTEIKKIHQRIKTTTIYVTHDQVEAMTLADRIVVMNAGKIEQIGSPQELYEHPRTKFVAGFIGSPSMNFVSCRLERVDGHLKLKFANGMIWPIPNLNEAKYAAWINHDMILGVRPEHITEKRAHTSLEQLDFKAKVDLLEPMGNDTMVYIDLNRSIVCARSSPSAVSGIGQLMEFTVDMTKVHLVDPENDLVVQV